MSTINTEWIMNSAVGLLGIFAAYIWNSNSRAMEKMEASFESQLEAQKKHFEMQILEIKARDDKRNKDLWDKLKAHDEAISEIKEMRGAFTAKLESIGHRMKEIPTQKEILDMLKQSEDRIKSWIDSIMASLVTKK